MLARRAGFRIGSTVVTGCRFFQEFVTIDRGLRDTFWTQQALCIIRAFLTEHSSIAEVLATPYNVVGGRWVSGEKQSGRLNRGFQVLMERFLLL